ncbi:hypothetical protein CXG81DRAFT_25760 [Caulochytrium protostelioides]|uniref:RIB43A-domain-containing protein n=2 Tax=Caulochytrium protostelioides TaxID=1555241 RepID=A0A4P9X8F4_9FUNG|nr:hypothetical protein CXG81DRAFT_25760 [Caulochytrium protostelioides]|eukprot:RKP01548.1 hypothetical protein CXG81DRAFT_25760 [Caulochytrium protostelioides]
MYKVEIVTKQDALTEAALERRRRLEAERKQRIFDTKTRVMGLDLAALNAQVDERRSERQRDAQRDAAFAHAAHDTAVLLDVLDRETSALRRQQLREQNAFHQEQIRQRPAPSADPHPHEALDHVAALQRFDGEDERQRERKRLQAEQNRVWAQEQQYAKQQAREAERAREREAEALDAAIAAQQQLLSHAYESQRQQQQREQQALNAQLAVQRRAEEHAQREQQRQMERDEVERAINSALLTESAGRPTVTASGRAVRMDHYKGMTDAEIAEIARERDRQYAQQQQQQLAERRQQEEEAHQQNDLARGMALLHREQERLRRERSLETRRENERLAMEARQKRLAERSDLLVNREKDTYYTYWNQSSR